MRLKFRLAVAVGCAGFLVLSLPAFASPTSRAQEHGARTDAQVLPNPRPLPKPRRHHVRASYHVPSYVKRLVAASRPLLGWPALVTEARKYLGTNPTDRKRLWCATFMNLILGKLGYAGTNSDAARSFAYYGKRIARPEVGAIAVLTRGKRGGHVGVVTAVDPHGNPVIISGNHNKRVGEGLYPRSRVIAYVMPTRRKALSRRTSARRAHAGRIDARRVDARRTNYSRVADWTPDRPIESPITELLATIEAEQAHAEARAPRRAVRRRQAPSRLVQQMPD